MSKATSPSSTWIDQVPNPESRVTLDETRDALGMRRARTTWRLFDYELDSIRQFNEFAAMQFGLAGVGRMRVNQELRGGLNYMRRIYERGGGGHQLGTTRMSDGPATGVVDRNARVHGIGNLYCAGSSVFTTAGWVNPTMTIVALSLRLADHLRS